MGGQLPSANLPGRAAPARHGGHAADVSHQLRSSVRFCRPLAPSCAGLAFDRKNRSNQIESHPKKNPGAGPLYRERSWFAEGAQTVSSFKFAGRVFAGVRLRICRFSLFEKLLKSLRSVSKKTHTCPVTNSTPTCGPGAGLVRAPRPKPRSRPRSQGHPRTVTRAETCAEEGLVCDTPTSVREVCQKQTHFPESLLRTAGMPRRTCEGALKYNTPAL